MLPSPIQELLEAPEMDFVDPDFIAGLGETPENARDEEIHLLEMEGLIE